VSVLDEKMSEAVLHALACVSAYRQGVPLAVVPDGIDPERAMTALAAVAGTALDIIDQLGGSSLELVAAMTVCASPLDERPA
jgi:hypothetical protein